MRKEIKYEARTIEDVLVDLADEIKNGWKIYSFCPMSFCVTFDPQIEFEVTLYKEKV